MRGAGEGNEMTKVDKYNDWTKYHITHSSGNWKFKKEGAKRSITTRRDRQEVIREALYKVNWDGGLLTVHKEDGTVDFIVDNWDG